MKPCIEERAWAAAWWLALLVAGCAGAAEPSSSGGKRSMARGGAAGATGSGANVGARVAGLTLRSDVKPVTDASDALPGVFIPPFDDCRDPSSGDRGKGPNGQVCTHVAISGCTEEGRYFPDYGSCDVVRTQRPFWPAPPTKVPSKDAVPGRCGAGEGVSPEGMISWKTGTARYVYVTRVDSKNPGVPPNLDTPEGTIWRLDVLANARPLESGIAYGATPPGSFQAVPEASAAPALTRGAEYHLTVLRDVGLPVASCVFTFGTRVEPAAANSGTGEPPASAAPASDAGDSACTPMAYFGKPCTDTTNHSECGCSASYCALQPGNAQGYCTATDCVAHPDVCPAGWSCFDISMFAKGQPAICLAP